MRGAAIAKRHRSEDEPIARLRATDLWKVKYDTHLTPLGVRAELPVGEKRLLSNRNQRLYEQVYCYRWVAGFHLGNP